MTHEIPIIEPANPKTEKLNGIGKQHVTSEFPFDDLLKPNSDKEVAETVSKKVQQLAMFNNTQAGKRSKKVPLKAKPILDTRKLKSASDEPAPKAPAEATTENLPDAKDIAPTEHAKTTSQAGKSNLSKPESQTDKSNPTKPAEKLHPEETPVIALENMVEDALKLGADNLKLNGSDVTLPIEALVARVTAPEGAKVANAEENIRHTNPKIIDGNIAPAVKKAGLPKVSGEIQVKQPAQTPAVKQPVSGEKDIVPKAVKNIGKQIELAPKLRTPDVNPVPSVKMNRSRVDNTSETIKVRPKLTIDPAISNPVREPQKQVVVKKAADVKQFYRKTKVQENVLRTVDQRKTAEPVVQHKAEISKNLKQTVDPKPIPAPSQKFSEKRPVVDRPAPENISRARVVPESRQKMVVNTPERQDVKTTPDRRQPEVIVSRIPVAEVRKVVETDQLPPVDREQAKPVLEDLGSQRIEQKDQRAEQVTLFTKPAPVRSRNSRRGPVAQATAGAQKNSHRAPQQPIKISANQVTIPEPLEQLKKRIDIQADTKLVNQDQILDQVKSVSQSGDAQVAAPVLQVNQLKSNKQTIKKQRVNQPEIQVKTVTAKHHHSSKRTQQMAENYGLEALKGKILEIDEESPADSLKQQLRDRIEVLKNIQNSITPESEQLLSQNLHRNMSMKMTPGAGFVPEHSTSILPHPRSNGQLFARTFAAEMVEKIRDINSQIIAKDSGSITRFVVDAGNMGELDIEFNQKAAKEQITVYVDNDGSKQDMQKIMPQIEENLQQRGFNFSGLEVEVRNNQKESESAAERKQGQSRSEEHEEALLEQAVSEDNQATTNRNYGYNTMEVLA